MVMNILMCLPLTVCLSIILIDIDGRAGWTRLTSLVSASVHLYKPTIDLTNSRTTFLITSFPKRLHFFNLSFSRDFSRRLIFNVLQRLYLQPTISY